MAIERNLKDNMKSTWRTGDRSKWNRHQRWMERLNIHPTDLDRPVPVHKKDDKMPYLSEWQQNRWVFVHALWPMVLHQLFYYITGHNLGYISAYILYTVAFKVNSVLQLRMFRQLGHKYGFLDGDKHERDQVPDASIGKVWFSLQMTSFVRPLMTIALSYYTKETPLSISYWTLLELGVYSVILDFWFYWYHRTMHESDTLWKFHRTHHLTKHPNPLLTLFADSEQEFFDAAGIPLLAYITMRLMGLPMHFYDWWVCHQYIAFTELAGHSGLRVFSTPPSTLSWLLKILDAELIIEDHDLHHRKGWKQSSNYGKQTRLWDTVFGTRGERIESIPENIDYNDRVILPLMPQ